MIPASEIVLSGKNLSVGYQKKGTNHVVLSNLNFALKKGQLVCFMGPNGVGKSTLIRTLCRAQPLITGQIELKGKDISRFTDKDFASAVSVVLTDNVNVSNLTVRELVSFGRYPYTGWNVQLSKEDEGRIENAISCTGLESISSDKLWKLSDGQRQKAMIARALCQDTPIIILDEPTAHLDLNNRVEVINLLKELAQNSGKAILMATHELDLALQAADELWIAGYDTQLTTGFPEDLVLNGQIDKVFRLKGFDLKTGHLEKKISKRSVNVVGESYQLLWTKNALERNGYGLDETSDLIITVQETKGQLVWQIKKGTKFGSLRAVINYLDNL